MSIEYQVRHAVAGQVLRVVGERRGDDEPCRVDAGGTRGRAQPAFRSACHVTQPEHCLRQLAQHVHPDGKLLRADLAHRPERGQHQRRGG